VSGSDARAAVSARRARRPARGQTGQPDASQVERAGRPTAHVPPAMLRGRIRLALIRDLAMGEWSHADIAKELGTTAKEVRAFADAHTTEIAEVSSALAGRLALETAGLWISKKQNRVAELQALYDDGAEVLEYLRSRGIEDSQGLGSRRHASISRSQLAILAAVAGEYEPRGRGTTAAPEGERHVVRYVIDGLNPENLT
jgi:hypothetical protein